MSWRPGPTCACTRKNDTQGTPQEGEKRTVSCQGESLDILTSSFLSLFQLWPQELHSSGLENLSFGALWLSGKRLEDKFVARRKGWAVLKVDARTCSFTLALLKQKQTTDRARKASFMLAPTEGGKGAQRRRAQGWLWTAAGLRAALFFKRFVSEYQRLSQIHYGTSPLRSGIRAHQPLPHSGPSCWPLGKAAPTSPPHP